MTYKDWHKVSTHTHVYTHIHMYLPNVVCLWADPTSVSKEEKGGRELCYISLLNILGQCITDAVRKGICDRAF